MAVIVEIIVVSCCCFVSFILGRWTKSRYIQESKNTEKIMFLYQDIDVEEINPFPEGVSYQKVMIRNK